VIIATLARQAYRRSIHRRKIGRDTKLSSLEVSIDRNDVVGACDHGYACAS
jgi:hypothetical protein